jgi:tripartite-type tricarboxylate transporter receptor subunit TctC
MKIRHKFAAFALISISSSLAIAQAPYPNQVIKLVVPFTPGSTSDVTARIIAQKLSGSLGQPVLVENRPGANGGIGMQAVSRSKPDGYTLVVGSVSSTVVPSIIFKSNFRPTNAFAWRSNSFL